MLFGNQQYTNLPEEVIEILIQNDVATSQWETIGRTMRAANNYRHGATTGARLYKALRDMGIAASTVSGLYKAWTHSTTERGEGLGKRMRPTDNRPPPGRGKEHRVDHNQPRIEAGPEIPKIEAAKPDEGPYRTLENYYQTQGMKKPRTEKMIGWSGPSTVKDTRPTNHSIGNLPGTTQVHLREQRYERETEQD